MVLKHYDTNLYDLQVKSEGRTETIHTTSNHLFWDPHLKQWVPAAKLKKGERLKTADGTNAVANGGTTPKQRDGWMWDLTIPGDHDFYIQSGREAILVHNVVCRSLPSNTGAKYIALGTREEIQLVRDWEDPEHEVLTLPRAGEPGGWTPELNDEWVDGAVAQRQYVYLASRLTDENLFSDENPSNRGTTVFGREVFRLLDAGYTISPDEQYMFPPPVG